MLYEKCPTDPHISLVPMPYHLPCTEDTTIIKTSKENIILLRCVLVTRTAVVIKTCRYMTAPYWKPTYTYLLIIQNTLQFSNTKLSTNQHSSLTYISVSISFRHIQDIITSWYECELNLNYLWYPCFCKGGFVHHCKGRTMLSAWWFNQS